MRALLDVNVLIALPDAEHLHHETARRWLRENIKYGWATCPITQNGCLRVMARPAYPQSLSMPEVAERLREATAAEHHRFWSDDVSLLSPDVMDWHRFVGPKQITDVYRLASAVEHRGRFVTFDTHITPDVVSGANNQRYCVI